MRLTDVQSEIKMGLRTHARKEGRRQSVHLAGQLSEIYSQTKDSELQGLDNTTDIRAFFGNVDRDLQRSRKTLEVLEDSLDIGLGHSKLARLAMTGAQLNSGVALVIAVHNLLINSDKLHRAYGRAGSVQKIAPERFHDFYRAIGLVIVESILFTTPINYRIAWKGTRYLNNKFIYILRYSGLSGRINRLLRGIHRLLLSEIHYAIRGILPAALRTPDEFITYLVSMATQTISLLRKFSGIELGEIPTKAKSLIQEYQAFVDETYEVVAADVDLKIVVKEVVSQVTGGFDYFALSLPKQNPRLGTSVYYREV